MQDACRVFGYSKQAYYKSISRKEKQAFDEYLIVELIREKRRIWKKGSGRNLLTCYGNMDCWFAAKAGAREQPTVTITTASMRI